MTWTFYLEYQMRSSGGPVESREPGPSEDRSAVQVKICGIQEAADALVAAQAGADFIGLVFVPQRRRRLSDEVALRIVSTLREKSGKPPRVVGLFADQSLREVDHIVRYCDLDMVQLCGGESLDYCGQVGVPSIRVLHISDSLAVEEAVVLLSQEMMASMERGHLITLDRKLEGLQGGTGQSFNWDIAKALSMRGLPFLLAGGLTPENVGLAVRTVRPWGVDVSSGVEMGGVKDEQKIRAFIHAVHAGSPGKHFSEE